MMGLNAMYHQWIKLACLFIVVFASNAAYSTDFLPPDTAFKLTSQQQGKNLTLSWEIADGYYLYEDRISTFYKTNNSRQEIPLDYLTSSTIKNDRNFGEVPVFYNVLETRMIVPNSATGSVWVEYQGCSKKGLCYQPQLREITLTSAVPTPVTKAVTTADTTEDVRQKLTDSKEIRHEMSLSELNSNAGTISDFLAHTSFFTMVGIFLLLGIGLSFTPCILPMVPILSGIIVGQGDNLSVKRGVILSTTYVLGMSITYALAGVAAATFGAKGNLQMYMQNPWAISMFASIFVLLSLSMFGLYNLALPSIVQNKLFNLSNKQQGGHLSGVFIMGALSALVASPCVSAPLAGALVFISSTGDKLVGASALFALGIGMGLPLIAIGAGGGKLIPKAGLWMNQVKNFFGVILLGVAIWLLSRIIPGHVSLMLWAVLFIVYAVHSGSLEPANEGLSRSKKSLSFMLLLYGSLLFFGSISGGTDPFNPIDLSRFSQNKSIEGPDTTGHNIFTRIETNEDLDQAIKQATANNKPVILDFYADWCTACIDMERKVFTQPAVEDALKDFIVLQADVTKNSENNQKMLDRFGLFGPPSIILFNREGIEKTEYRIQGELDANDFLTHLSQAYFGG